jgi:DNA-binding transcriptional LysR family regulator
MKQFSEALDPQLLRVLKTLLIERSVTRTAVRLNQSQPAVSASLRRLRKIFGDELMVRDGNTMVPTERGLALEESVGIVLDEIERMLAGSEVFEPTTARQTFSIGCPDYLSTVFMAGVARAMRREAPSAHLSVHPLGPGYDFERAMARGELDVVIGNWPQPPEGMHIAPLLTDTVVCLMCRHHRLAHGGMTQAQYLAAPHVVPTPFSSTHRGVIDQHLSRLRLSRNARIMVPFFHMAPYMLPGTDLIFTISRHFAQHYAAMLPLVVVRSPIDYPPMRFYQLWHTRTQQASPQRWLRTMLGEVANQILQPTGAVPITA